MVCFNELSLAFIFLTLLLLLLPLCFICLEHLNNSVFKASAQMTVITAALAVLSYQTTLFESADR